jgi:outer membrane receptor for ferrienterochelin and colicins
MTRAALAFACLCVCLDITANVVSTVAAASDTDADRALASLARLMATDISTRDAAESTDETPGIVAVLDGRDLRNAGIATVREALALIPGIDLPAPQFVRDEPVMRGVGGFFTGSSGKLRYMVNGTVTNNVINANSTETLDIPVALVERIELIRGAGSALHGEYAYLATLNVVTRQAGDAAGIELDSFEGYRVSARTGFAIGDDGKASLAVAFDDTPGEERRTGEDLFHATGFGALSNAPGDAHLAQRNYQVFFDLENGGVALNAFALGKRHADAFGASNALTNDDSLNREIEHAGINLEVTGNAGQWDLTGRLGVQRFRREGDTVEILPAGGFGVYPDALVASSSEGEDRLEADMTFGRDIGRHRLLAGVEFARSEADDISYAPNFDESNELPGPVRLPAPLDEPSPRPLGYEGRSRDVISAFVSDRFRAGESLEATLGLRVDDYSDVGTSTSPRAAVSYRVNDNHVVKSQLSRAFRPPAFLELYTLLGAPAGNARLDAETVDTAEIAHVYRRDDLLLQTSLFTSHLDDLIRTDERNRFINAAGVRSEGVEFEFDYRSGPSMRWFGNIAWLDTEDEDTGERVAGSTNWLANLGVSVRRGSRFSAVLRYQYVGQRYRGAGDPREPLDGFGTFHAALSWRDVLRPGVTVRFGVNNILDDEARDPSPFPGYEDDYPGPGREFWLRITRDFR